jgi:hypothetical protein
MEKKSPRAGVASLRKVLAEPVTDPKEQAELDEQRNRQPGSDRRQMKGNSTAPQTSSPLVELCRQLPPEERPAVLMRMAAGLAPEGQVDLLEQLASGLPAEVARQWEEELRARLAK